MRAQNVSVVFSLLAALLCWPGLDANNSILTSCHEQCRAEEELKATCKIERNCEGLLPNFDAFLNCLRPCGEIGSNCFQRCAFKTDDITNACLRHCNMMGSIDDVNNGVSGSAPAAGVHSTPGNGADVSSDQRQGTGDVSGANADGNVFSSGTLCYRSCYDHLLNSAMNRLYRKRPVEN